MPETRTVGQLVADTIRLYGERFWRVLPLGLSVAVVDQLFQDLSREGWVLLMVTVGGLLMTVVVRGREPDRARQEHRHPYVGTSSPRRLGSPSFPCRRSCCSSCSRPSRGWRWSG